MYILDFKQGDVNGDTIVDKIYLIGEPTSNVEMPFTQNITLVIQDGATNAYYRIPLKENAGYHPTLFLGDFIGNHTSQILISIDSGGSGGYAFYYIYSFVNNTPLKIFDHELYNQSYTYTVNYMDGYQAKVVGNDGKSYVIDLKYKGSEYLNEIYDANGKLKNPIDGWVNPLGGVYPVDFQRDGILDLYTTRRIAGRYNADGLGYVQTALQWQDNRFVPLFQTVGIMG